MVRSPPRPPIEGTATLMTNAVWIVVALGIAGGLVAWITSWRRAALPSDLGVVSRQWLAEHQLDSTQDSQR
jgi:hypothetical protein